MIPNCFFKELVMCFLHHKILQHQSARTRSGSSYRSIAFYKNAAEKKIIEDKIRSLPPIKFANPIVTEVKPVMDFYEAEDYHQDYVKTIPISLM
jgi:peptide-methionine (S)-S-oxide reductase